MNQINENFETKRLFNSIYTFIRSRIQHNYICIHIHYFVAIRKLVNFDRHVFEIKKQKKKKSKKNKKISMNQQCEIEKYIITRKKKSRK